MTAGRETGKQENVKIRRASPTHLLKYHFLSLSLFRVLLTVV